MGKILAGIVGGLFIAIIGMMLVNTATGEGLTLIERMIAMATLWAGGITVAIKAPSIAKSWRRIFIILGVMSLTMPIAAASAPGVVHAGAVMAGTGIVSFFPGALFLIIGLLIGRDGPREVIVIDRRQEKS